MTKSNGGFGNQARAITLFLTGLIIAASLVTGGSLSPFGGGAVGWVGKFISEILGTVFGISSYLVPAACLYFSVRFLLSRMGGADFAKRAVAFAGLLISSSLFAALALEGFFVNSLTIVGAGGKLGALVLNFTHNSIGSFGSYTVALTVMAGCLIFLSGTNLVAVAIALFKAVKLLGTVAVAVLKFCVPLIIRTGGAVKNPFSFIIETMKKHRERKAAKPAMRKKPLVKTMPPEPSAPREEKKDETPPKIVIKERKEPQLKVVDNESADEQKEQRNFQLPPIDLLDKPTGVRTDIDNESAYENARMIEEKLQGFGVSGKVTEIKPGPVITMFEYKPASNVRVSRISSLSNDLAMSLSALKVRIISPIPGRDVVGIEVPNQERETVCLRELIENKKFSKGGLLTIAVGKNISGTPYYTDLATAPHLMVAGTTGSGKSVLMNSLLASMFYKAGPDRLRLLMIDPKMLEFSIYEGIPHLLHPIVTEHRKAAAALKWAVGEMESRYSLLSEKGVRSIDSYNTKIEDEEGADSAKILPYIVIVIDELGDLVMSGTDTQGSIIRIAQKARAAGIHLVVATQRPSADVVSGLLKANIPARISFLVSSRVNSNIVLDAPGAETLLGKGDMLFLKPGATALERIQGAFITDGEREKIVEFLKSQAGPVFDEKIAEAINKPEQTENGGGDEERDDDMYEHALAVVRAEGQVSISMLQRRLKIGYNRAATIVEQMEREGIVGEHQGAGKAREVNLPDGE